MFACKLRRCGLYGFASCAGFLFAHGALPQDEAFFGAWGVDLQLLDERVSPGDDFYRFVNGRWLEETTLPSDALMVGARTLMRDRNSMRISAIMHEFAANGEQLTRGERNIGALFKSFIDTERRDALGISVLAPDLESISRVSNRSDLAAAFARSHLTGWKSPFTGFIETDFNQPDRRVYFLDIGGLGMSGGRRYLSDDEPYISHRKAYGRLIEAFLDRAGYESPEELAAAVISLEASIADASPSAIERGDFANSVHAYRLSQVSADFPGFDWPVFFQELGIAGYEHLIVRFPESVLKVIEIIKDTPLEIWRAYLSFHLINENAPFLDMGVRSEQYRLFTSPVYGTEQGSVERGALRLVQRGFSFELGRAFVERHFSPRAKREVEAMFENVRHAFKLRLDALDWMDAATKAEAYAKLEQMRAKIGYPHVWREEPDVDMAADDLMDNLRQLRADRWRRAVQMIGTAADPKEWGMAPQSAGAGFHPALNEITVPAGNLMPPFFDDEADDAVNYGAIGGVLGARASSCI